MPTLHVKAKAPPWPPAFAAPKSKRLEGNNEINKTFVAQVAALEVDEVTAKVQLIDPSLSSKDVIEVLSDYKQRLLNRMTPGVYSVTHKTGRKFKLDCGDLIMPKGNWIVVVTVTRIS